MKRVILFSLLALSIVTTASAQTEANLLKGHNPSFEKGRKQWEFELPSPKLPTIVSDSAPNCGAKALKMTYSTAPEAVISPMVEITSAHTFKYTFWLKMKPGLGYEYPQVNFMTWYRTSPDDYGDYYSATVYFHLKTEEWTKISWTETAPDNATLVGIRVEPIPGTKGVSIFLDCASIKPSL